MRSVLLLAFILLGACGDQVELAAGESAADAFDRVVPTLLDRYDVPGAAIALVRDGDVVWTGTFGLADAETGRKVDAHTLFNAASISKPVTAWGVMRLVEAGQINRYRPLPVYLPEWPLPDSGYSRDSVTTHRLLSHTAGLSMPSIPAFSDRDALPTLREILSGDYDDSVYADAGSAVRIIYEPNGHPRYSGGGYVLAQLLIEEVTGRGFAEYMSTEILNPLGMTESRFGLDQVAETRVASPHDRRGRKQAHYYFTGTAGAGLYATARDLGQFVAATVKSGSAGERGRGVLAAATVEELLTPVVEIPDGLPGELDATGLGYFVETDRSGAWLASHSGGNIGWRARIVMAPDAGKGIAVMTNSDNGGDLIERVLCLWASAEKLTIDVECVD